MRIFKKLADNEPVSCTAVVDLGWVCNTKKGCEQHRSQPLLLEYICNMRQLRECLQPIVGEKCQVPIIRYAISIVVKNKRRRLVGGQLKRKIP